MPDRPPREVVFDTETTGLDPRAGHRIVEVGCVELMNYLPTGREFYARMKPPDDAPWEMAAEKIHGIKRKDLEWEPPFEVVWDDLREFLRGSPLVIHNADFDLAFLDVELRRLGLPPVKQSTSYTDTLKLARELHPGAPASLDALCKRFRVPLETRSAHHGALIDARLLAAVYLQLRGGRQQTFAVPKEIDPAKIAPPRPHREPRPNYPTVDELAAFHVARLKLGGDAVWGKLK